MSDKNQTCRPRHHLTHADRVKGGKARASMPDFPQLCLKGWEATATNHGMKAALAIIRKRSGRQH